MVGSKGAVKGRLCPAAHPALGCAQAPSRGVQSQELPAPGLGAPSDGPGFPRANGGVEGSDLIKEGGELSHTFKIIV